MASTVASPPAFTVRRRRPELVAPAKPTPRELKPLSDIDDQEGLRFDVPMIMFYGENPSAAGKDPARVIKEALAAVLVYYYPLAGRLVEGADRKLMVDCTAEGVLFVEADADVGLQELGDSITSPCPNLEELIYAMPAGSDGILGCPLRSFQVTRLSCGGFIVGFQIFHALCDGTGIVQFLNAVAEMARGAHVPSLLPVWARETTLVARRPPRVTCPHHEFDELEENAGSPPLNPTRDKEEDRVQSSFFFGPKEIRALRARLPPRLASPSPTTYEIITACLLRCRTVALEPPPDAAVRIGCPISVRGTLHPPVPDGYYGNALVYPVSRASQASRAGEPSLGHALELVKQAAAAQANDEYVRSLADFLVINGRRKYNEKSLYIVSDNRRVGYQNIDFGWGKPIYGGPATASSIISALLRYKNGTVASIALPKEAMERFHHELKEMTREESKSEKAPVHPESGASKL